LSRRAFAFHFPRERNQEVNERSAYPALRIKRSKRAFRDPYAEINGFLEKARDRNPN